MPRPHAETPHATHRHSRREIAERDAIERTLRKHRWNETKVARDLGSRAHVESLNDRLTPTSNPAMRPPTLAILLFAVGCSSSSSDPSSADTGADTSPADAAHDVAFDVDTSPADSGCPLAYDPASIDCAKACANYVAWCETTSCKSPYCDKPTDCAAACNATKGETGYTNALFGCAAQNAQCVAYETCVTSTCPAP